MRTKSALQHLHLAILGVCLSALLGCCSIAFAQVAPAPLIEKGKPPVDWWFVFKFNTKSFPGCAAGATRACLFGGAVQDYRAGFSQQFIYASKTNPSLQMGSTCLGDATTDPVGATFDQVYNGPYNYVVWNDQFYNDPDLPACQGKTFCDAPWAHSKGMLAWNDAGDGFVMQVSTPNWPGAGSNAFPRQSNGNTLGCLTGDAGKPQDNVLVSQHFFALKLNKDDVVKVLKALQKASVVTQRNPPPGTQSQIVKNGGPSDIQDLVRGLGPLSEDAAFSKETLSTGVQLISKPPLLHVPPWQMVSAILGGVPLRVATWLTGPHQIHDTDGTRPGCWNPTLGDPAPVTNAERGLWRTGTGRIIFGLTGGPSPDRNHAKIGVSASGNLAIFGDLNQEGALSEPCDLPQNTRGGLFFVVEDETLAAGLRDLLD
jgi:Deoxyribonuclease II